MKKIEIFCVTNISSKKLETLKLSLAGVGKKKFPSQYISCVKGKNIQKKEKNYSELTFHYSGHGHTTSRKFSTTAWS